MDMDDFKKLSGSFSPTDISASNIQALIESERWKAKFETLQEALENERKERKELETNLNKLAFELGAAKNEIKLLEDKIKLLTSGAGPERLRHEAGKSQPAVHEYKEEPKTEHKVAQEPAQAEVKPSAKPAEQTIEPEPKLRKEEVAPDEPEENVDPPKLFEELWIEQFKEEEKEGDLEIKSAIAEAYQEQAEKVWELGDAILEALSESPNELCYDFLRKRGTEDSIYTKFIDGVAALEEEFGKYRNIVEVVDYDLKSLNKVIPHLKTTCSEIFHSG